MGFSILDADADVLRSGSADGRYVLPFFVADFYGRYLEVFPRHLHAKISH